MQPEALFDAVIHKSIAAVETILKTLQELKQTNKKSIDLGSDPDAAEFENFINSKNSEGKTLLYCAVKSGELAIVKLLLKFKADPNLATKEGVFPLHIAICKDKADLEIITNLCDAGANINQACPEDGMTPLIVACIKGHEEVVKFLIDRGADVNLVKQNDVTPLFCASGKGNVNIVKMLIEAKANVDLFRKSDEVTPIFHAASKGFLDVVALLIDAKANLHKISKIKQANGKEFSYSVLQVASLNGHVGVISLLLDAGAGIYGQIDKVEGIDFKNKIVIGLEVNRKKVTRKTPGFEYAITTVAEFKQRPKTLSINQQALIVSCQNAKVVCSSHIFKGEKINELNKLLDELYARLPATTLKNICLNMINQKGSPVYNQIRNDPKFTQLPEDLKENLNLNKDSVKGEQSFKETVMELFSFKKG